MAPDDGGATTAPDVAQLLKQVWLRSVGANILVASTFFVGLVVWHPVHFEGIPLRRLLIGTGLAAIVVFGIAAVTSRIHIGRRLQRATGWLSDRRRPRTDEIAQLTSLPRVSAVHAGAYWTVAPVWATPYIAWLGYSFGALVWAKVVAAWTLIAVAGTTLSYLVVDRTLRPLRVVALADEQTIRAPRTLGLVPRLVIVWIAAAGLPLSTIALFLVGTDPTQRSRSAAAIWYVCLLGLAVGIAITFFVARTITEPLNRVREGLRRVGRGDLEEQVPVDETGELSDLQLGFNQMVRGLREHERIRDLFGRHVGADVARRAMEGDHGLGGEQREATAMFVDVVASTRIAQTHAPDDVVAILNAFFDAVVTAVTDEGGLLNKFAGDGAMCIFGAPLHQPDHAERALRAARTLRDKLAALDGVEAAIGISSGVVVAGNVGALDRYEYTVVGDPVNEASRLTEHAKATATKTRASANAIAIANSEAAAWRPAEKVLLRGRITPTETYEPAS